MIVNWTSAFSSLLTCCHAGFWSNGVGGAGALLFVYESTLLPRPDGGPCQAFVGFFG
jgi:hypothetical protein